MPRPVAIACSRARRMAAMTGCVSAASAEASSGGKSFLKSSVDLTPRSMAGSVFHSAGGDQGESRTDRGDGESFMASRIAGMIYLRSRSREKPARSGSERTSGTA